MVPGVLVPGRGIAPVPLVRLASSPHGSVSGADLADLQLVSSSLGSYSCVQCLANWRWAFNVTQFLLMK